jgi:hypothetical protein
MIIVIAALLNICLAAIAQYLPPPAKGDSVQRLLNLFVYCVLVAAALLVDAVAFFLVLAK